MLGHFNHDVVGIDIGIVFVAAQALQTRRARSEDFHRLALRQGGFAFFDFLLLAETHLRGNVRAVHRKRARFTTTTV